MMKWLVPALFIGAALCCWVAHDVVVALNTPGPEQQQAPVRNSPDKSGEVR